MGSEKGKGDEKRGRRGGGGWALKDERWREDGVDKEEDGKGVVIFVLCEMVRSGGKTGEREKVSVLGSVGSGGEKEEQKK